MCTQESSVALLGRFQLPHPQVQEKARKCRNSPGFPELLELSGMYFVIGSFSQSWRLSAQDPKSCASASSATLACVHPK